MSNLAFRHSPLAPSIGTNSWAAGSRINGRPAPRVCAEGVGVGVHACGGGGPAFSAITTGCRHPFLPPLCIRGTSLVLPESVRRTVLREAHHDVRVDAGVARLVGEAPDALHHAADDLAVGWVVDHVPRLMGVILQIVEFVVVKSVVDHLPVCVEGRALDAVELVAVRLREEHVAPLGGALILHEGHVRIDILISHLGLRNQILLNIISSIFGAIIFLVLTWYGTKVTWEFFQMGTYTTTLLELPKGPLFAVIPIGSLLLFIQFIRRAFKYLANWQRVGNE